MSDVTDDWDKWVKTATDLAYRFQLAVEYNARDDEFAAGMDMMEFLQKTVAALKSEDVKDTSRARSNRLEFHGPALDLSNWEHKHLFDAGVDFGPEKWIRKTYDDNGGPDKEGKHD